MPSLSGGPGQAAVLKSWGDGGNSKQRPAGQRGTAKRYKVCWSSQGWAEQSLPCPPVTPAKTGTFGDPRDQNKESQRKELRSVYVKIKEHTNPCLAQTQKYLNGLGVLAQSLQLTPTNLEPSIRRKGEREPESARNEISGLISHTGSSIAFTIILNIPLKIS